MTGDPAASLAEEAARFVAAIQGLADEAAPAAADRYADEDGDQAHRREHAFGEESSSTDDQVHDPTSTACRYCPVCNVARLVASVTPEVRAHLASAAMSLALAAKAWSDGDERRPGGSAPVEKIDLAED